MIELAFIGEWLALILIWFMPATKREVVLIGVSGLVCGLIFLCLST